MLAVIYTILILLLLAVPAILIGTRAGAAQKKLKIALYLMVLLWIARFVVGLYYNVQEQIDLSAGNTLFDSLIHALQSFSMDEDYTMYTTAGKAAFDSWFGAPWGSVYGSVISVLNVCAPVLGGALLLDILTNAFPHIRLYLSPFTHKFVFSELNAGAVTLAEDIMRGEKYREILPFHVKRKPLLVFTDAYTDETSEYYTELLARARKLGAVCIRTDLLHLSLYRSHSVDYFLLDEDVMSNVSALVTLLEETGEGKYRWPSGKKNDSFATRIYVFVRDTLEEDMVTAVLRKKNCPDHVMVRAIHEYKNAAINLMHEAPLFLPLLSLDKGQEEEKELTVTVFGDGAIAKEVVKAVFWCGQMEHVRLHLHVLGEHADKLRKNLETECPEMLESCDPASELLTVCPLQADSVKNPPYCAELTFTDMEVEELLLQTGSAVWEDTDYYVVALASDQKNTELTEKIRLLTERLQAQKKNGQHKIIAPVISGAKTGEVLRLSHPADEEPYILPFADLESIFSCQNVFLSRFAEGAGKNACLYDQTMQKKEQKDTYSYWANIARAVHGIYKLYSLGLVDSAEVTDKGSCTVHEKKAAGITQKQADELAWLEHRRWVAFMRTQGFICPTKEQYDTYFAQEKTHKSIRLKMHNCLAEAAVIPYRLPDTEEDIQWESCDALDLAGIRACKKDGVALEDRYKKWDYWMYDELLRDMFAEKGR